MTLQHQSQAHVLLSQGKECLPLSSMQAGSGPFTLPRSKLFPFCRGRRPGQEQKGQPRAPLLAPSKRFNPKAHLSHHASALFPQLGCRIDGGVGPKPLHFCYPPLNTAGSTSRHLVRFLLQDLPGEGLNCFCYSSCGF